MKKRGRQLQMQKRTGLMPATKHTKRPAPKVKTWWNFEPCRARIVRVITTGGEEREAVEISDAEQYGEQPFYLDNKNGEGWFKVTEGRGSPWCGHSDLKVERVIGEVGF